VEVTWGDSAREIWRKVYGSLSEGKPGLFGAAVGRAEAQVARLAALYAVMSGSHEIEHEHLLAALALWDYSEKSARYIFGDATGDVVADQTLEALRAAGKIGMTRTEISHLFGRNRSSERITQALNLLLGTGRARRKAQQTGGPAGGEVVRGMKSYELNEICEESRAGWNLSSFLSSNSYRLPKEGRPE
jgi:hypothetical protein